VPTAPALFETLDDEECLRLLATAPFGRVVATAGALPLVVPVNFALDGRAVVFRTTSFGTLAAATRDTVVAFQADAIDAVTRCGWSVALVGVAEPVTAASDVLRMDQLGIEAWAPGERNHYVRVVPGLLTGRYLLTPG
jgi:uncharacterized protein